MKRVSYIDPAPLERGVCFLCREKCDEMAYLHTACAEVGYQEIEKRRDGAIKETEE